jgi:CheY-like chemotaxis protein
MNNNYILLVDDDDDDQYIFVETLKELGFEDHCALVNNGIMALDYLNTTQAIPSMIVLDLNLPLMNGYEFLNRIKNDDRLSNIPVIVFTTSDNQNDQKLAAQLGATFITKSADFTNIKRAIAERLVLC